MAAAKRAEIERRLADLQMQREREEALLKELNDRSDTVEVSAADIRNKATASTTTSCLTVFGQRIVVGDRVKTTTDQQLFRKSEAANPRRDTLKKMYLGEPGTVVSLFESFHGRAAVELRFADRTRHIFFADCLVVGDAADRLNATKDLKAITASAAEPTDSSAEPSVAPAVTKRSAAAGGGSVPAAPSALPTSLPRRPKVIPKANATPSSFLAELQLMADVDSDVSAAPVTPGPGRTADGRTPLRSATAAGAVPVGSTGTARASLASRSTKAAAVKSAPSGKRPVMAPKASASGALPATSTAKVPASSAAPTPARVSATASGRTAAAARVDGGPAQIAAPSRVATAVARAPSTAQSSGPRPVTLKVYENGSYGDLVNDRVPFRTVTVRPTFKTMGPVLSLVGQTLQWGQLGRKVEVLFDAASGKPITSVADLQAGSPVIASMGDALIVPRANSQLFSELPEEARDRLAAAPKPRAQSPRVGTTRSLPTQPKPSVAGPGAGKPARAPPRAATKQATAASTLLAQIEQLEGRLESV